MIRLIVGSATALIVLFSAVAPVHADKETSVQLYKAGKRKYELGEFDRAIGLFQQAYDEHPAPAYLYNIAQAYLKLENCPEALKHFKRFVAEKPDAPNRAAVDDRRYRRSRLSALSRPLLLMLSMLSSPQSPIL